MIPLTEVKSRATDEAVDEATIELDYVLGWLLLTMKDVAVLDRGLVFKGGTALRKIYAPTWRYSEDLDFTVHGELSLDIATEAITNWCRVAASASGLAIGPVAMDQRPPRPGGRKNVTLKIPFVGPLEKKVRPRQIKLDVSFEERLLLEPQRHSLDAGFSDQHGRKATLLVYAIEEILAEKLRSLLQRREPRDLYDAWRLLVHGEVPIDTDVVARIFPDKCAARSVDGARLEEVIEDALSGKVAEDWQMRLAHQVRDLPRLDKVVRELKREVRRLRV